MKKFIFCFMLLAVVFQLHSSNINWSLLPTTISDLNVNAYNPQISMDANGNIAAVWIENELVKSSSKLVNGE